MISATQGQESISISMGSSTPITNVSTGAMGQEPPAQIDHDTTAAAPAPSANTEAKPQLNVLVSEIRDELRDIDLAPLALVGEDAIVFLAESDWTERPVMAVA